MKNVFLLLLFMIQPLHAAKVVIIGAGPVGLATAIEASAHGHEVTLVEMRNEYTRKQTIILDDNSLALLETWQVPLQSITVNDKKIGMIAVKELEEALKRQVSRLGIKPLLGTYIELHGKGLQNKQAAVLLQDGTQVNICYDILVGADGAKSKVREDANIAYNLFGRAFGKIAVIQVDTQPEIQKDAFTPLEAGGCFVMKIPIPQKNAVILCMQSTEPAEQNLHAILQQCNWPHEEEALQKYAPICSDWFEIPLQQASRFFDEEKNIILVGDAAASASYLRGGGLNTGFQTAHFAGLLFNHLQEQKAYFDYNERLQKVTDKLIYESRSLYTLTKTRL